MIGIYIIGQNLHNLCRLHYIWIFEPNWIWEQQLQFPGICLKVLNFHDVLCFINIKKEKRKILHNWLTSSSFCAGLSLTFSFSVFSAKSSIKIPWKSSFKKVFLIKNQAFNYKSWNVSTVWYLNKSENKEDIYAIIITEVLQSWQLCS